MSDEKQNAEIDQPTDTYKATIKGYSTLTDKQRSNMNQIKELEEMVGELFVLIVTDGDADPRSLATAKTHMQTAFMWFNRAVAKPADFYL